MFDKLGKQYAGVIADKVEVAVNEHFEKNNPTKTEHATETIGRVSGKRRALFIGINYFGQRGELKGCINDVHNIKRSLLQNFGLDEFRVLTDDQKEAGGIPTRANILAGFRWLRAGAKAGDSLILHYSGHGGSIKDTDGDEEDGMDETMIPVDHKKAGIIVDDEIHDVLVRGLPKGVRLTAIIDCCHSESMLDLPYTYNVNGDLVITENERSKGISKMVATGVKFAMDGNKKDAMKNIKAGMKTAMSPGGEGGDSAARARAIQTRSTVADVVQFSGCKDSQTSADAQIGGQATGAMSYALITALKEDKNMTYTQLLKRMRQILEGKYSQVPMMTAGRKLNLNSDFSL